MLRLGEAHLAGAHQQHPVGQPEALEEDLGAFGHPLERGVRVLGPLEQDHLDLVELVDAEDAARVLAGGAGLAPEAGRVRGVADRQLGRVEDLVAVQVRDRDLGGRDQVQVVARDDVHLVFLVRDLAGARAESVLTTAGGQTSVIPYSRVWTSRNQLMRPRWSADAGALVDREAGAGDLRAAGRSRMSRASASSQWGLRVPSPAAGVGADLATIGWSRGSCSPHVRTVTLASSPPTGMSGSGGFGMRSSRSSRLASTSAELRVEAVIRSPAAVDACRSSATSGPSGAPRP